MRLLCLLAAAGSASAELRLAVYNTTAFGGPLSSNGTTSGGVSGTTTVGCNQSAEYVGSLAVPAGATLLGFAADVGADVLTLRVWAGEFLVLQSTSAAKASMPTAMKRVNGALALPANILAESPLPVRIHYARLCSTGADGQASPGHLSLLWSVDNSSSLVTIPAAAFSPVLTDAQEAREAMRTRLYEPSVPWQTYVHSSMAAHTLQPSGLVRFPIEFWLISDRFSTDFGLF